MEEIHRGRPAGARKDLIELMSMTRRVEVAWFGDVFGLRFNGVQMNAWESMTCELDVRYIRCALLESPLDDLQRSTKRALLDNDLQPKER